MDLEENMTGPKSDTFCSMNLDQLHSILLSLSFLIAKDRGKWISSRGILEC